MTAIGILVDHVYVCMAQKNLQGALQALYEILHIQPGSAAAYRSQTGPWRSPS